MYEIRRTGKIPVDDQYKIGGMQGMDWCSEKIDLKLVRKQTKRTRTRTTKNSL